MARVIWRCDKEALRYARIVYVFQEISAPALAFGIMCAGSIAIAGPYDGNWNGKKISKPCTSNGVICSSTSMRVKSLKRQHAGRYDINTVLACPGAWRRTTHSPSKASLADGRTHTTGAYRETAL